MRCALLRTGGNAVHAERSGNVLDLPLSQVREIQVDFAFDVIENSAGNAYAAGLGQPLETRGDVHAVAIDVVALDDDVAEVDADAQLNAPVFGHIGVAFAHRRLDVDRATDRVDDARELGQRTVAHELDDAPPVLADGRVDGLVSVGLQARQGPLLIVIHEAAVADHVGGQDRG